ncbi:MAG: helix-turn-helix transcriptional regulator [Pseudanabaenales cyanobacterium]|nr:helix-turn-helix transcriptional regulator [Pseudanabaenales cyanobacterium]
MPNTAKESKTAKDSLFNNSREVEGAPDALKPLIQEILDNFLDGILILSETGELIQTNAQGRQILAKLTRSDANQKKLLEEILHIYQTLRESNQLFPDQPITIETDINAESSRFCARARFIQLTASLVILITLTDKKQAIKEQVAVVAQEYGLTPRETEVWLLRQSGYSFQEIAAELFISLNTVKKHMKSIHAKMARDKVISEKETTEENQLRRLG